MQLFTIGLVELKPDGTVRLDAAGQPIPTYDAGRSSRVSRTSTRAGPTPAQPSFEARPARDREPSRADAALPELSRHGAEALLGGTKPIPAGQTGGRTSMRRSTTSSTHPNVGPFIAQRLIQRLVTSNPSPRYVAAWRSVQRQRPRRARRSRSRREGDPARSRGARPPRRRRRASSRNRCCGSRSCGARMTRERRTAATQPSRTRARSWARGRCKSPSVFNFFGPDYAPPGEIRNAGLVAPELEIATEYLNTQSRTVLRTYAFSQLPTRPASVPRTSSSTSKPRWPWPRDPDALVNRVADKLLGRPDLGDAAQRDREHRRPLSPRPTRRIARREARLLRRHVARIRVAAVKERHRCRRTTSRRLSPRRRQRAAAALSARARRRDRPDGRRLGAVQRLPRARLRVSVRRQRLVQHARAAQPGGVHRLRGVAAESRDRAGSACCRSARSIADGAQYGVHPSMAELKDLFDRGQCGVRRQRRAAARADDQAQYQAKSVPLPPQLFSHNDQQDQWHALRGRKLMQRAGPAAWPIHSSERREPAARDERLAGRQHAVSVRRRHGSPYTMGATGPLRSRASAPRASRSSSAARSSASSRELRPVYARGFAEVQRRAVEAADRVTAAIAAGADVEHAVPDVAARPAAADRRAADRRARSARDARVRSSSSSTGGFDSHDDQIVDQPGLLGNVSACLAAFYAATVELGVAQASRRLRNRTSAAR